MRAIITFCLCLLVLDAKFNNDATPFDGTVPTLNLHDPTLGFFVLLFLIELVPIIVPHVQGRTDEQRLQRGRGPK